MTHCMTETYSTPGCVTEILQKDSTLSSVIPKKDVCLSVFPHFALLLLLVTFLWYSAHKVIVKGYYWGMGSSSPQSILEGMMLMVKDKNSCASFTPTQLYCVVLTALRMTMITGNTSQ